MAGPPVTPSLPPRRSKRRVRNTMLIRDAQLADVPALARVHVDSWRSTYAGIMPAQFLADLSYDRSEARFRELMALPGHICMLVEDVNDAIVGFASAGPERSNDPVYRGELYAIYLLDAYRRRGIGTALLRRIAQQLRSLDFNSKLVWVLLDNPSRQFYEKLGGVRLRQQPIDIGGAVVQEVAYGWTDLRALCNEQWRS